MTNVLILGGGVAGLTAAHELVQRGFKVQIWEKAATVGGRARSQEVHGLPTEHGFHFFPAFYRHLRDTLIRIPDAEIQAIPSFAPLVGQSYSPRSVGDALVPTSRVVLARDGTAELPFDFDIQSWNDALSMAQSFARLGLSPAEVAAITAKLARVIADVRSGDDDALDETTWWDYIEADSYSDAYRQYLGNLAVRWTVAMDPRKASARTIGRIATQFWMDFVAANAQGGPLAPGALPPVPFAQVLCGPTSKMWLDPWMKYLVRLGVEIKTGHEVWSVEAGNRREVTAVEGYDDRGTPIAAKARDQSSAFAFDYCICALPIPALIRILERSPTFRDSDPRIRNIAELRRSLNWMVGLQFFLDRDVPVARGGVMLRDAPWALTLISQTQFWNAKEWAWNGSTKCVPSGAHVRLRPPALGQAPASKDVKGVLSVIISDWDTRGEFQNLSAKSCTPDQLFWEVWQELKAHLNNQPDPGGRRHPVLEDEHLVAWASAIDRVPVYVGGHTALEEFLKRDLDVPKTPRQAACAKEAHRARIPTQSCRQQIDDFIRSCEDAKRASGLQLESELKGLGVQAKGCETLEHWISSIQALPTEAEKAETLDELISILPTREERWENPEPLFVNTVGSRANRPDTVTHLHNFFMAGDYVITNTDLATMEAANESGRRAVNAVLDAARSPAPRCGVWPLNVPLLSLGASGLWRGVAAAGAVGRQALTASRGAWRSLMASWRKP